MAPPNDQAQAPRRGRDHEENPDPQLTTLAAGSQRCDQPGAAAPPDSQGSSRKRVTKVPGSRKKVLEMGQGPAGGKAGARSDSQVKTRQSKAHEKVVENDETGMLKTVRGDSEKDNDEEDRSFSTPKMSATQIDEETVPDLNLPTKSGFVTPADLPPLPVYPNVFVIQLGSHPTTNPIY